MSLDGNGRGFTIGRHFAGALAVKVGPLVALRSSSRRRKAGADDQRAPLEAEEPRQEQ
ncbi:hypothetical protein [Rhodanobacter geophilus]|uniref:Uncharacterized protein n=1 Tax=Rhodanobacter geophilus TaxID=3162488 RepID=A0ABV3QT10_9GAMM